MAKLLPLSALLLCLVPGLLPASAQQTAPATAAAKSITVLTVPTPYRYHSVAIVAGGFITGMVPHPTERNLMYLRTDIGGAYRSEDAGAHWTPLTDWVSAKESNLLGIESIAVDPTDANKLYLAAGTYDHANSPNGAVLRSNDRGRTFETVPMPFKMGGNEDGRFAGERMAVDPNQPTTLYLGTRLDGLWRSLDSGKTWARVDSFGGVSSNRIGVVFVTFVPASGKPGAATPVLYAGVSAPENNLWRSTDAGQTWAPVAGSPRGIVPNHGQISGDDLYLTFGDAPGPNDMKTGAVWKLDLRKNRWQDITPERPSVGNAPTFGYGGLAVDAEHSGRLLVSTMDHWNGSDNLYLTSNGGRSWQGIKADAVRDASLSPWLATPDGKVGIGHWLGALMIDPFDGDHAFYGTGETVWMTHDLAAAQKSKPTHWQVGASGIEETAVITLVSPPVGPHLFSGLGDIGCFRNDNFDLTPGDGALRNPRLANCDTIDYAAGDTQRMVRVGTAWSGSSHGAVSHDGGQSWTPFATEPANARQGGRAAISGDGKLLLWATGQGVLSVSANDGATWKTIEGQPARAQIVADQTRPEGFFLYDGTSGTLSAADGQAGGLSFKQVASGLPTNGRLAAAPRDRQGSAELWISSQRGLWHMSAGTTPAPAVQVQGVQQAYAIGFGMPQAGGPATLFLSGVIADEDGIFRSVDGGTTWSAISDHDHRYGYIGVLAGDPRVFGRVYLGSNGRGVIVADPASTDLPAPYTR